MAGISWLMAASKEDIGVGARHILCFLLTPCEVAPSSPCDRFESRRARRRAGGVRTWIMFCLACLQSLLPLQGLCLLHHFLPCVLHMSCLVQSLL